jgi:hypothetical protein
MSIRVISPECILSFPDLFEADEKGKFGAALVFPAGTDLTELKKAVLAVAQEKFGDKAAAMIQKGQLRFMGGPHHTFRTDGEDKYGEGAIYINARSNTRPGIVSIYPDAQGRPSMITDESQIYPGCVCKVSLSPFYYDIDGNKGITWGLNNIQKIRDGDRLDSRVSAADEFSADPNAMADLASLTAGDADGDDIMSLLK